MYYRIRNTIVVKNALHRSWIWLLGSSDLRVIIEIEIVFFTEAVAVSECNTGSATTLLSRMPYIEAGFGCWVPGAI